MPVACAPAPRGLVPCAAWSRTLKQMPAATIPPEAKAGDHPGEQRPEMLPVGLIPVNRFSFMAAGAHTIPTARLLNL